MMGKGKRRFVQLCLPLRPAISDQELVEGNYCSEPPVDGARFVALSSLIIYKTVDVSGLDFFWIAIPHSCYKQFHIALVIPPCPRLRTAHPYPIDELFDFEKHLNAPNWVYVSMRYHKAWN